jgi:hypothetical protein
MAAFVPGYEWDVFISYAHIDNRASRWVQSLEDVLRNRLAELAGTDVAVWRDPKLDGNDYFDSLISQRVTSSAVFVAVVSPRYVTSEACRSEYHAFVKGQTPVRIAEKSRIARVRKTPLPAGTDEPPELDADQTLGFPFFEEKEGQLIEYENDRTLDGYEKFLAGVKRLAGAIDKVLRLLKSAHRPHGKKQTVFLAETVNALAASRDELKRELIGRGHRVVPDRSLVIDGMFSKAAADQAVGAASLAVHLLGGSYGLIPDTSEHSIPHLEYALAANNGLPQLIWIPPEPAAQKLATPDKKLAALIEQVTHAEAANGRIHDVCRTDFEAFKDVVLDAVAKEQAPISTITEYKSVYLLFHSDDIDSDDLKSIRRHLLEAGYPVNPPVFEAPDGELRQIEAQLILDNDATLIYYGSAKDSWIAQKRQFLLSALGSAQRGSQNRRALYLCPPRTKSKEFTFGDFKGGKPLPEARGFSPLFVVGDCEAFSREKLTPLLSWLSE